jgi:MEMO1 family protein
MDSTRRMAVAGSWYPDEPITLAAEVNRYVAAARVDLPPRPPCALIAPHAGLMYSGPVAAFAYKVARGTSPKSVILVGPSHFVPFRGVSIWPDGQWSTPFGPVAVDRELAHAIQSACSDVVEIPAAHGREHSLEMQLPFIAHLLPGTPIVPLVMGQQTRDTAFALGDALARVVAARAPAQPSSDSNGETAAGAGHGGVLLVASSDLSHYENASVAAAMDEIMAAHVQAIDADGMMAALERDPRHACGGGPMVSVLRAARQLGATGARVLRYADSGDVSGDKSSVVGYMAAAVW